MERVDLLGRGAESAAHGSIRILSELAAVPPCNPAYFRAAKGMWAALQQETTRVPGTLRGLLNRRVAWWNGCEF